MFRFIHIFNAKSLSTNILRSSNYYNIKYNIKLKHNNYNVELEKNKIINSANHQFENKLIENKLIKKFIPPTIKIEMHESHSSKPFIKNSSKY
jgi:hypothetical protein